MGPAAERLLLQLLEGKQLTISAEVINYHGQSALDLVKKSLLVPDGFDNAVVDEEDHGRPRLVERGVLGLGYHSSVSGWVGVTNDQLRRYRIDVGGIFSAWFGGCLRTLRSGPAKLDGSGFVWDIGSVHLERRLVPLWFARRLSDVSSLEVLNEESGARPAADVRLILTSTPRSQLVPLGLRRTVLVSIHDVLSETRPGSIEVAALAERLSGRPAMVSATEIWLSQDDSTLTIRGAEIVTVRGKIQKRLLRLIVDAHNESSPIIAANLLQQCRSGATSFDQAFGESWKKLKTVLRSDGAGAWQFDL